MSSLHREQRIERPSERPDALRGAGAPAHRREAAGPQESIPEAQLLPSDFVASEAGADTVDARGDTLQDGILSVSNVRSAAAGDREPPRLLAAARRGDREALGRLLAIYGSCLHVTARARLPQTLGARVGASDLVQETCLDAHRDFEQFAGKTEEEFLGWLRGILEHNIKGAVRDHAQTRKRAVIREQSLNDSKVAVIGAEALAAQQSSPSGRASRAEDLVRLAREIEYLPPDQRTAVRLRHLFGWPLEKIAAHVGRSLSATAGLVKRGMCTLRERLQEDGHG